MCKLMLFTDVSKLTVGELKNVLLTVAPASTDTEQDGFGWAGFNKDGIVGERYVNPKDFDFRISNKVKCESPLVVQSANSFGKISRPKGPLIVHGRTSTNKISLINTHPFVKEGCALVHNGVVFNEGPDYKQESTCDTEDLIHYMTTMGIKGVTEYLSGYYAFGMIDTEGKLHVVKDATASLVMAYIETIESYVFATTAELIVDMCEVFKWKRSPIERVRNNFYAVYEGNTMVKLENIDPMKDIRPDTAAASKSAFGYQSNEYNAWEADVREGDEFYNRGLSHIKTVKDLYPESRDALEKVTKLAYQEFFEDDTHEITFHGQSISSDDYYQMLADDQEECIIRRKEYNSPTSERLDDSDVQEYDYNGQLIMRRKVS